MEKRTEGAWLLSHSKKLDNSLGTQRFENVHYSGKIGRLYSVLRRETATATSITIPSATVQKLCQLNNIDVSSRREGLRVLSELGRIDVGGDGSVDVLGATTTIVLETTSEIFQEAGVTDGERALIYASEVTSSQPQDEAELLEQISDEFKLARRSATEVLEVAHDAALLDKESYRDKTIVFSQNVFRSGESAKKTYFLLQSLSGADTRLVVEAQELLHSRGAVHESELSRILGQDLLKRLLSVGFFDRMEVNNEAEAAGYLAAPDAFQRYGRPFEEDPIDDAKALLASLTYGMSRSSYTRGQITLPTRLLNKLIEGGEVGDEKPVRAIGEDYREVERRGVVQVIPHQNGRFSMKLLKEDVGHLARAIIQGQSAAEESLLMSSRAATSFRGPEENRVDVRKVNTVNDRKFVTDALDAIRSGG